MFGKTHILISQDSRDASGVATYLRTEAAGTLIGLAQPSHEMDFSAYSELTWVLEVAAVVGSPSSWTLDAKFQYRLEHTTGYQYTNPKWFDLATPSLEVDIVEGAGFAQFTATGLQKRTLRNFPPGVRLLLTPAFTGGTNPGLAVNLTVAGKG